MASHREPVRCFWSARITCHFPAGESKALQGLQGTGAVCNTISGASIITTWLFRLLSQKAEGYERHEEIIRPGIWKMNFSDAVNFVSCVFSRTQPLSLRGFGVLCPWNYHSSWLHLSFLIPFSSCMLLRGFHGNSNIGLRKTYYWGSGVA